MVKLRTMCASQNDSGGIALGCIHIMNGSYNAGPPIHTTFKDVTGEFDKNDWSIIGNTVVKIAHPATVEPACATIVNRIPQLLEAPPGYCTTEKCRRQHTEHTRSLLCRLVKARSSTNQTPIRVGAHPNRRAKSRPPSRRPRVWSAPACSL